MTTKRNKLMDIENKLVGYQWEEGRGKVHYRDRGLRGTNYYV